LAALLALPVLAAAPAAAEENGERLFSPCRACHSLDPEVRGLPGPNLAGLIGRAIGGDPAFDYSPVLRKAHNESLRWNATRLDAFLADPAAMFPAPGCRCAGSRMRLNGKRWCAFWHNPRRVDG
jgi:cytochrome c